MTQIWPQAALDFLETEPACVRVVVLDAQGSTPRESGAWMIVGANDFTGSIGGGRLEYDAIARARGLLSDPMATSIQTETIALGPSLGQCCGGRVTVGYAKLYRHDQPFLQSATQAGQTLAWYGGESKSHEVLSTDTGSDDPRIASAIRKTQNRSAPIVGRAKDPFLWLEPSPQPSANLVLFGAGHVGQEIVRILETSGLTIDWVDQRADTFPQTIPNNVRQHIHPSPAQFAETLASGTRVLVLTHDHQLDLEICNAVLRQGEFAYFGLIGSETKSVRFRKRLGGLGHSPKAIGSMICPIGENYGSKKPFDVAMQICINLLNTSR